MKNRNLECARFVLSIANWGSERTAISMPLGQVHITNHRVIASIEGYTIFTRDWLEPIDIESAAEWMANFWGDRLIGVEASVRSIADIADPLQKMKAYTNYFLNDCPLTKGV